MARVNEACYYKLKQAGITPILQCLDNKISREMSASIIDKKLSYQLVDAYDHRNNPAERAIGTFKNHFTSILNGCDPNFPSHLWCRLLPQAELTLNMLRPSRINPKLSAHSQLFGLFNFNNTPLAPLGTKAVIYEPKQQRPNTFASHGKIGWYVAPALHHYRNYSIYIPQTRAIRLSKTVKFLPTMFDMPETSSADRATAAIEDLVDTLRNPSPASPFFTKGSPTNDALRQLQEHFNPPVPSSPTTSTPVAEPRVQTGRVGLLPKVQPVA